MPSKAYVFYQCPSTAGAYAALAFHLFVAKYYTSSTYIPFKSGANVLDKLPNDASCKDSGIYFLDGIPHTSELVEMAKRFEVIHIFDNKNANINLLRRFYEKTPAFKRKNIKDHCNEKRASVMLLCHYISTEKPAVQNIMGKYMPIFQRVEDYDMKDKLFWKPKCSDAHLFIAGLDSKDFYHRYDINTNPQLFSQLAELDLASVCRLGVIFISEKSARINEVLQKDVIISFPILNPVWKIRAVKLDENSLLFMNDVLQQLLEKPEPNGTEIGASLVYYEVPKKPEEYTVVVYSSCDNGAVEDIACYWNGSGNKNKKMFSIKKSEFTECFLA